MTATPVDVDAARVDRLYARLRRFDELLADSVWHRVEGWRRLPVGGSYLERVARKRAGDLLAWDLRRALLAAGDEDWQDA